MRRRDRFGRLLMILLGGYVLTGVAATSVAEAVFVLLLFAALLLALWSEHTPASIRRFGLMAGVALVVASLVALAAGPSTTLTATVSFLIALIEMLAIVAILRRVFEHEYVTWQTVLGAVTGYTLLAFVAAAVYRGLDLLQGGGFLAGESPNAVGDYLYFSLITLTTVGYGDIVPATQLARHLVGVQALVGQVFLVTLVARLVSLWGQPIPPHPGEPRVRP